MKAGVPTLTETKDAIIIRIPKNWVGGLRCHQLTESEVLQIAAAGEREFRKGTTQEFGAFLAKGHPAYAKAFRRAR